MLKTIFALCCIVCFGFGFFGVVFPKLKLNWIAGGLMFGALAIFMPF